MYIEVLLFVVSSIEEVTNYYLRRSDEELPEVALTEVTGSLTGRGPDRDSGCDVTEGHVTPWMCACATGYPAF